MSSPFEIIEGLRFSLNGFWERSEGINRKEEVLICSSLKFVSVTGKFKERKFALTKKILYRYSKNCEKIKYCSVVCWKKLEPFTEVKSTESRFGFRLGHSNVFQDFYTESSKELDNWIDCLSQLVILSDPDEDFTTIKEIGKGNYGTVFLIEDNFTNHQFAMKTISKSSLLSRSKNIFSLKNEIETMRKISHPGVIKLNSVYETQENICLVLNYLNSGDLFERVLKLRKYSEQSASLLIYNLLSVLSYLHSLSIVHRDLKPENILMKSTSSDTDIVLCDFGLACLLNDNEITRCGSPGYVAPEVFSSEGFTEKVDIFAAGVILYILLTGCSPFPGSTQEEILTLNRRCKIKFNGKIWNGCSHLAIDFVSKLLNPDPVTRPTANEALSHPWICKNIQLWKECTPVTGISKSDYNEISKFSILKISQFEQK